MTVNLKKLQTAIWIYDIDHSCVVWANQAALKLWNSPSLDELINRDIKTDQSVAVKESLLQYQQAFRKNQVIQENWSYSPKGKSIEAFCQFSGIELEDGRMAMLVEATTTNLLHSHMQLGATTMLSVHSTGGQFISGNPPFIKNFGESHLNLKQLFCAPDTFIKLKNTTSKGHRFEQDVLMNTLQGETWFRVFAILNHNEQNESTLLLHHYNIHERKTLEQNLRQQAWTDPLTGLLNRRGLTHELKKNVDHQTPFSLLYIDLDGFKMVNDSLGHNLGDNVLVEVCQRLKKTCHNAEILCRFGGDEFIVIDYHEVESDYIIKSQELITCLSKPYQTLQGKRLSISASIGVAHYPENGTDIEHIISCADAAMYQAKKQGKKRWVEYQTGMELKLKRMSYVSQNLALADKNKELQLYYQPIIDVSNGEIISFEALLRWRNEELGKIDSNEIIRVAEETGLIYEIENWVLSVAIRDLVTLKKLTTPNVTIAVNLSGLHLSEPNLADRILQTLCDYDLQPEDLTIELTESVLLSNINNENAPTQALIDNGIKVSIDDFGTGYSSLAYLHNIPASIVKIDKSFLDSTEHNTITLECIHRLVTSLNMECLIEGIETQQQANLLKSIGYNLQQGYFHGKPKPIEYYLKATF